MYEKTTGTTVTQTMQFFNNKKVCFKLNFKSSSKGCPKKASVHQLHPSLRCKKFGNGDINMNSVQEFRKGLTFISCGFEFYGFLAFRIQTGQFQPCVSMDIRGLIIEGIYENNWSKYICKYI